MISELLAVLVVVVLGTTAILFYRMRPVQVGQDGGNGLPKELESAHLLYAEETFKARKLGLVATLDRAYRVDGMVKLVELKTRMHDAAYMSDIIEMSVQRLAVQEDTGETVSTEGWVVVQNAATGSRRPHRVRLLGEDEVVAMRQRFIELSLGGVQRPAPAKSKRQCEHCAHRQACTATFRDR